MAKNGAEQERKRIGDLLLDAGVITGEQLEEALEMKKSRGGRLCLNLIRTGALHADDLLVFLKEQFGVAAVNLDNFRIQKKALNLIPSEYAWREKVVPLHLMGNTLTVAMIDPGREEIVEEIQEMTGKDVDPLITPEASLENALEKYYGEGKGRSAASSEEGVLVLGDEKKEKHLYLGAPPKEGYSPEDWLRRLLLQGIKKRSREIHLEPGLWGLRSRYRVGERLFDGETVPPGQSEGVTSTALALARLDYASCTVNPLEGRFRIEIRNRSLRLSLSSFPTLRGERLVLKIAEEGLIGSGFQELGMSKEVSEDLQRILHMGTGILLVSAPPGQGKTTTFYNLMHYLREDRGRNVMTLEYPVQDHMDGVSQTQISFGQGVDFYYGLRALLRQNPDVVGLTDISDCRTLELVFSAARQCLVVGLCSFWDNQQALEWIEGCRIGPAQQSQLLRGLLAQRVLSRICSQCRSTLDEPVDLVEGIRDKNSDELVFHYGKGCGNCGQTGRAGRQGIFEMLAIRYILRDLLARNEEKRILYDEAQRLGMWTLREDGIMKASQGLVDIRDVLDLTGEETGEE